MTCRDNLTIAPGNFSRRSPHCSTAIWLLKEHHQSSSQLAALRSAIIDDILSSCLFRFSISVSKLSCVSVGAAAEARTGVRAAPTSRANEILRVPVAPLATNVRCVHLPERGCRAVLGEFGPRTYNDVDLVSVRRSMCSRQLS